MIDTDVGNFCAALDVVNTTASTKQSAREFRSETDLEHAIKAASDRMLAAPDRDAKMQHWREMCRLIDQRTPHRVRFMERMRSLKT
jgi:hypothetical protein